MTRGGPAASVARMAHRISHWIDGRLVPGTSGRTGVVFNPARGVQSGEVELASAGEVAAAVASAEAAAAEWRAASLSRRSAVLVAVRGLLPAGAGGLAGVGTADHRQGRADGGGE